MAAGFSYEKVLSMDMISFAVCLRQTFRRRQEEILTNTYNQRVAQHADAKSWKRWVRGMEKSMEKKVLGPDAFESAFLAGHFNKRTHGKGR